MTALWKCPLHGVVGVVRYESHSQMPYCVLCGRDVDPVEPEPAEAGESFGERLADLGVKPDLSKSRKLG